MDTVLVAEDEPTIRDVVAQYLRREGYATLEAGDGDAARELLEREWPSLVVLDLMLPGTDGLALCRWIRDRSQLPVIMLTARGYEADRIVGLELGADDYVKKPFSRRELVARVRTVLRRGAEANERVTVGRPRYLADSPPRSGEVERWDDLAEAARTQLARQGASNVDVVVGDGSEGLPEHPPYDAILVAAACPHVPPPLVAQFAEGGRLVQPIGSGGDEEVVLFAKRDGTLHRLSTLAEARFVPLIGWQRPRAVKPVLAGDTMLGRGVAERLASASPMSLFAQQAMGRAERRRRQAVVARVERVAVVLWWFCDTRLLI